jgi:predicted O-methyltransferase YrrM
MGAPSRASGGAAANLHMRPVQAYAFTHDWFSNHIATWRDILTSLRPIRIIEIGCYEGRATSYLIESCVDFGPLDITCIDTWAGSVDLGDDKMAGVEARFDENVRLALDGTGGYATFRKLKQTSATALAALIAADAEPFDLVYIDGSHTAPDVLADAVLAFQLLRVGGVIIFDDYLWSMEPPLAADPLNMPKLAIDVFTTVFARKVRVLAGLPNAQCYVEKISR